VFRGIGLKALDPGNINYLLWAIIGYLIATACWSSLSAVSATSSAGRKCTSQYSLEQTPLWSAILMLGFLDCGANLCCFSDRFGGVSFAVGGMVAGAASFVALMALPADSSYAAFAGLLFLLGWGLFVARRAQRRRAIAWRLTPQVDDRLADKH
jgi:hypothetical protein